MKHILIWFLFFPSIYAHIEDLFPDQQAIIGRMAYADTLEKELKRVYKVHVSVSLFGEQEEHILILSPACRLFNKISSAKEIGIISIICRWYKNNFQLKFN